VHPCEKGLPKFLYIIQILAAGSPLCIMTCCIHLILSCPILNYSVLIKTMFKLVYQKFPGSLISNGAHSYNFSYLLTPWCRVLLEKLTGLQLVKKFPTFHRTRRFITALKKVHHLSLFWACPIQSIYPHPTSWRSILILSTHLRLGLRSGLFPSGFPTKTLYTSLSSPIRATCPAHITSHICLKYVQFPATKQL